MHSVWKQPPVYDRNNPDLTGPLVVNYDLDQLRVGENYMVVDHKDGHDIIDRDLAPGDGWSRALAAPECAWPRGAHLCVLVEWHPDRTVGSDWDARLEAVTTGLRSLGYVVERAGRPVNPEKDRYAALLVYRMEPDKTPPRRSADAWAYVSPPRPYSWRDPNPLDLLERRLKETKAARDGAGIVVRDIDSALWPPEADLCGVVRWWPAPDTSAEAVYDRLREMTSVMQADGYRVRTQDRPLPDAVETVALLVYREATQNTID